MSDDKGIRSPVERALDFWGGLDIRARYGLAFVAGLAIVYALIKLGELVM